MQELSDEIERSRFRQALMSGYRQSIRGFAGYALAATLLLAASCEGTSGVRAVEPWVGRPDLRVVAVVRGDRVRAARLLGPDEALQETLAAEEREGAELWLFGYSARTLSRALPGLSSDPQRLRASLKLSTNPAEGQPLPAPDAIFSAVVEPGLSYRAASLEAWRARGAALNLVVPDDQRCTDVSLARGWIVPGPRVTGLAVLDAARAFAVQARTGTSGSALLALSSGGAVGEPVPALRLRPLDFASRPTVDRTQGQVELSDLQGVLVRVGMDGSREPGPRAEVDGRRSTVTEVGVGGDGARFGLLRTPVVGALSNPPLLHRHGPAGWTLAVARIDSPTGLLRVFSAERILFNSLCWVYGNADEAALDWKTLVADGGCPVNGRGTTLRDADLDEALAIVVGRSGLFYTSTARLPAEREFQRHEFGAAPFEKVATVGRGEAVVVALDGAVSFYRQGLLCPVGRGGPPTAIGGAPGLAMFAEEPGPEGVVVWVVTVAR